MFSVQRYDYLKVNTVKIYPFSLVKTYILHIVMFNIGKYNIL